MPEPSEWTKDVDGPIRAPLKRTWRDRARAFAKEAAIAVLIVVAVSWFRGRELPSGAAPELIGPSVSGGVASLASNAGRASVVHFWATWCGVCRTEEGNIVSVAKDHPVFSVAVDSGDAETVAAWMHKEGVDFPAIADADAVRARAWKVPAYPTTFVLDGAGRIRFSEIGYVTEFGLRARLFWAGLF